MPFDYDAFEAELNRLGEAEVRRMDLRQTWDQHQIKRDFVHKWLGGFDALKRDAREEETLSIAREANSIARDAKDSVRYDRIIAIAAFIIAAIAAHKEIAWLISAVIGAGKP